VCRVALMGTRRFFSVRTAGAHSWSITLCQEVTNPGHQVSVSTKFCTVAPNVRGSSVRNLLHVTLLALQFWGCSQTFGKFVHPCLTLWSMLKNCLVEEEDSREFKWNLPPLPNGLYGLHQTNVVVSRIAIRFRIWYGRRPDSRLEGKILEGR